MAQHRLTERTASGFAWAARLWDLAALFTVAALLSAVAFSIAGALREADPASLWRSLLIGVLAGWLLAFARQPAWRAAPLLLLVGLLYILLLPGGLIGNTLGILREYVRLGLGFISRSGIGTIDATTLVGLLRDLRAAAGVIFSRVLDWVLGLGQGKPVFDPVASALVWNALMLGVSAWAGWIVEARRSALLAALPSILLGVGTLAYAGRTSFALYFVLGAVLLSLAIVQQASRQQYWDRVGLAYPREKGRQVFSAALLLTTVLVILSGAFSSVSVSRIQDWLEEWRKPAAQPEDHLAVSLGILAKSTPLADAMAKLQSPGLPRDLLIGSGPELSQRTVMTVALRGSSSSLVQRLQPPYWRSYTYDIYTGQGWKSSATRRTAYAAGQPLSEDRPARMLTVQQAIYPVEDLGGVLYTAGEPVTMDIPAQAAWRSSGDLFGVQAASSVPYNAVSMVPVADETALRAAGQKYPDWIRHRYLALPSNVPGRVKALAAQLTASKSAPYDRARAIEGYLRQFPYSLDVPRPPVSRDVVDYFLFDLKTGYCDYYASAMVVLARASGVPARLAVGYASGTYNLNSQRFVVSEADAHSWVEVYFPGIGWVPFEPTASRPALEGPQMPLPEAAGSPPAEMPQPGPGFPPWAVIFGAGAVGAFLITAGVALDALRLRRLAPKERAAQVYLRMRRMARWLEVTTHGGDTPYEFAGALTARLEEISGQAGRQRFGSRLKSDVGSMAAHIVDISFRPSPSMERDILSDWRSVAWRLRFAGLLQQWNAIAARLKTPLG